MSNPSERERIQALLDEGRLSETEAQLLFEALEDDPEVEAMLSVDVQNAVYPEPPQPQVPHPPTPPEPPAAQAELIGATKPEDVRWVRVEMFAGNLELEVDPDLTAPTFEGQAELRQQGRNYEVRQQRRKSSGLLEDVLEGTFAFLEAKRLVVRIPKGYGVDLNMKAGNAEIRGVPTLRGKMVAGNLNAWELGGIALDLKAGNLDASLKLTEGQHTLDLKAGGGRVRFLPGSDVQVTGEVKAGNFESRSPAFEYRRSYVGGTFHGTLGSGQASFTVQQKAGNLELEADDA
jgi:hypothetical protein